MASSSLLTSFSLLIYLRASLFNSLSDLGNFNIYLAKFSNPFSLAIVALVLFFSLNGRYKSSTLCNLSCFKISAFKSIS